MKRQKNKTKAQTAATAAIEMIGKKRDKTDERGDQVRRKDLGRRGGGVGSGAGGYVGEGRSTCACDWAVPALYRTGAACNTTPRVRADKAFDQRRSNGLRPGRTGGCGPLVASSSS